MNIIEAESKLDDYLMKGIVSEIFWADECKSLAVKIGKNSPSINKSAYAQLFGRLQTILSEYQTLAVAKIYDNDKRTRSVPSILSLIKDNAQVWQLRNRSKLEEVMISEGQNERITKGLPNEQLIEMWANNFESTLPHPSKAPYCQLSFALKGIRESRNKVHAHNEAVDQASRTRPTWDGTESLVNYAKDFVCIVAWAFLGRTFGGGSESYYLSMDASRSAAELERLLKAAKIVEDSRVRFPSVSGSGLRLCDSRARYPTRSFLFLTPPPLTQ
jgi:hypothetical protein